MYDDLLPDVAQVRSAAPVKAARIANKPQPFTDRLTYRDEEIDRIICAASDLMLRRHC